MNFIIGRIYKALHARLFVDTAYFLAGLLQPVKDLWDDMEALINPIREDEFLNWIGLSPCAFFTVNVSNVCNARCVFCAYPYLIKNGFRGSIMSDEVFRQAVLEWEKTGGKSLNLTPTVGEVLTDPDFFQKLEFARKTTIPDIRFYTNGLELYRNENWRKMIDARPNALLISLGGCDAESYHKSYGVDGYSNLIKGIKLLLEYNLEQGSPVEITLAFRPVQSGWALTGTKDFKTIIRPYLRHNVNYTIKAGYDNWGGIIGDKLPSPMKLRPSRRRLRLPCINLLNIGVLSTGDVRSCACRICSVNEEELTLGNIKGQTVSDLIKSDRMKQIVRGFYSDNRPPICRNCSLYRPVNRRWFKKYKSSFIESPQ